MRQQLALLLPYPGSAVAQTTLRASLLDMASNLGVSYDSPGQCDTIQRYYAEYVVATGWVAARPIRVLREANPSHNELDAVFRKVADGFALELTVACFVDQSFQGGYYVSLNIPPTAALWVIFMKERAMSELVTAANQPSAEDGYNYARFDGSPAQGDFAAFPGHLHVGERAPDATLTDLDGGEVTLSALWQTSHLLLEFGSYT